MLRVIDDWLDESVWMISAKVITEGRMVGLQKGSETPRDQWAHQVTAEALFTILHRLSTQIVGGPTPNKALLILRSWLHPLGTLV